MNLIIRKETSSDVEAIDRITIAAFLNAPHTDHNEQFIIRSLREAGVLSISLVVEAQGEVIGHVAVSPVAISDGVRGWFGLGPISVSPVHQCSGIGSLLMQRALEEIQSIGGAGCVLLGDPAYYSRFGFKPEPSLVLHGVPSEYFQAISFGDSLPNGQVTYHEAFNVLR